MIAREMRRERLTESDQALTMLDVLGLGAVTAAVVWVNWIVLS
jgi:hypothetical protein